MGVRMCVSSSTKFPVENYLCVYIMEALLEVLKRGAPRDVCVREIKGRYGCVIVCALSSLSSG